MANSERKTLGQTEEALAKADRRAANLELALDLAGKLAKCKSESEAIEEILDLFSLLFAPGLLLYFPCVDDEVREPRCLSGSVEQSEVAKDPRAAHWQNYRWSESGHGFILSISHLGTVFGVLETGDFAFPQYRQEYLNLALAIADICGLAVANARDSEAARQVSLALREIEARYRAVVENASIGIFHASPTGRLIMVNPALASMLGYASPEDLMASVQDAAVDLYVEPSRRHELVRDSIAASGWVKAENHLYRRDGAIIVVKLSMRKVLSSDGNIAYLEGFAEDITDRKRMEEDLQHASQHDPLTGLPNRRYLDEVSRGRPIPNVDPRQSPGALLCIDADKFKIINDTLGHDAGDRALQMLSGVMRTRLRPEDTLVRLGGDEFAVLLPGMDASSAMKVGNRLLLAVLAHPFAESGMTFEMRISIGVTAIEALEIEGVDHDTDDNAARHPESKIGVDLGSDRIRLALSQADQAMYEAKTAGGNRVALYIGKNHDVQDPTDGKPSCA